MPVRQGGVSTRLPRRGEGVMNGIDRTRRSSWRTMRRMSMRDSSGHLGEERTGTRVLCPMNRVTSGPTKSIGSIWRIVKRAGRYRGLSCCACSSPGNSVPTRLCGGKECVTGSRHALWESMRRGNHSCRRQPLRPLPFPPPASNLRPPASRHRARCGACNSPSGESSPGWPSCCAGCGSDSCSGR
jgi:hypothetical protein